MKKFLVVLILAASVGCSDIHYLRKAESAYIVSERAFNERCVEVKGPPECPGEEARLRAIYHEIDAALDATMRGPLPKATITRLKQIRKELDK